MKYTCALFSSPTQSLEGAQEASLNMIAAQMRVKGGEHVLDIGCGWGSLSLYLAERWQCTVTAITPSRAQADFVRQRADAAELADRVHVQVGPFQNLPLPPNSFDAIAMVEVIEHMPEHRTPLAKAYRLLRRHGRLFLSASCYRTHTAQQEYQNRPASLHALELYGFTAMAPLSTLVSELEDTGFSLTTAADTTAHYGPTMAHWQQRINRNRQAMEATQPGLADHLLRYFAAASASWGYTAKHHCIVADRSRAGSTRIA